MDLTALQPSVIDPTIKGKNFLFYGPPGTRKTSVAALSSSCLWTNRRWY